LPSRETKKDSASSIETHYRSKAAGAFRQVPGV
jgi:hypothetical protein